MDGMELQKGRRDDWKVQDALIAAWKGLTLQKIDCDVEVCMSMIMLVSWLVDNPSVAE